MQNTQTCIYKTIYVLKLLKVHTPNTISVTILDVLCLKHVELNTYYM